MENPTSDIKNTLKLSWLSFLEALYSLSPFQRLLAIGAIVFIVPGFWLARVGSDTVFTYIYNGRLVEATPSFQSPVPLRVGQMSILPISGGFTAYAEVSNPNFELSATKASYVVNFYDTAGQKVLDKVGQTWVEKGGQTTVVIPRFSSGSTVTRGELVFSSIKWQKRLQTPAIKLSAPEPVVTETATGIKLEGQIINNSSFTLGSARVVVFVYNSQNRPLAVAERFEFTLKPSERRAYVLNFAGISKTDTFRVVATADTNVSDVVNVGVDINAQPIESLPQK